MTQALSDVEVVLDVLKPTTPVNLGVLAIFMPASSNSMSTYTTLEDLTADVTDDEVIAIATNYFAQTGHSETLVVISYSDIASAADEYFNEGWEFAVVATESKDDSAQAAASAAASSAAASEAAASSAAANAGSDGSSAATTPTPAPVPASSPASSNTGAEDLLALSNYIEGQVSGFLVIGVPATDDTVTSAKNTKETYEGNTRTIVFASGADQTEASGGVGALIGALGNDTVGSITWKFKSLAGVTPVDYTAAQVAKLHDNGIFTYVNKAGIDQTSEGITVTGEFIDALHGDDWIKAEMESDLQKMLSTTDKLSYDAAGIAQVEATATAVLLQATANGIVLLNPDTNAGEYTVTAASRANTSDEDIATRQYNGLSFTYQRSGAIHSITVHGTVTL